MTMTPSEFLTELRALQRIAQTDIDAANRWARQGRAQFGAARTAIRTAGFDDRPGQYTGDWHENFGGMLGMRAAKRAYGAGARQGRAGQAALDQAQANLAWLASADLTSLQREMTECAERHGNCRFYLRYLPSLFSSLRALRDGVARPQSCDQDGYRIPLPEGRVA